jgi:hypothetical protein
MDLPGPSWVNKDNAKKNNVKKTNQAKPCLKQGLYSIKIFTQSKSFSRV